MNSEVLPRAAALVDHGGIGTCSQALRAGIPHLIQPMAHDQLDTLSRVLDLGVGTGLSPARFTGRRVAARLDELLGNPVIKKRAAATPPAEALRLSDRAAGRSQIPIGRSETRTARSTREIGPPLSRTPRSAIQMPRSVAHTPRSISRPARFPAQMSRSAIRTPRPMV